MFTLKLNSSITCLGCQNMRQYPNGFRSGLCFMCFPRSVDNRDCEINLNDILKMLFTRKNSFLKCDQKIIDFLRKELETNYFKRLPNSIPKGYQLNIGKNHYEDHNLVTGNVRKYSEGCIMILEPGANDSDNDIPLATFHLNEAFKII
jgi:hypothetical protein